ncbi:MAG: hypothetical protein U0231_18300 [Nitrospiraceae bacterium]
MCCSLFYSRELTGTDYLGEFFLQQLEASLRRKIEVDRIKLVLLPSLRLELTSVGIYGHDDPTHRLRSEENRHRLAPVPPPETPGSGETALY